ncbi:MULTISPECIES: hypothetical protein [Streptomyces]|uniref:hypothetical protein n=1 Tax=Streptomyces TaxID=1883 RepID=UPI0029314856|nr:hypothetical protein [Streptomyces sp. NEAU-HV9]
MDRTSVALRRSQNPEPDPPRSAQPTAALRTREPIYAQLVAEWRAEGRCVPADPDLKWTFLAGLPVRIRPGVGRL